MSVTRIGKDLSFLGEWEYYVPSIRHKECHAPMGRAGIYGRCTPPPIPASKESLRVPYSASRASLSRWFDHRVALLVNQGSNPTVPYQAWVIPESARLFLGFAPWGR